MTALIYPHISKDTGDVARLERIPRVRVAQIVADYLNRGWSVEEIVLQYPHLTFAEVHAALTYYFDHRLELNREIEAERAAAEVSLTGQLETPLLARLRLLKRQTNVH